MDKDKQEVFFQLLKNTYEKTQSPKNVSLDEVMESLKSELSILITRQ
ncbi:hypothetical protein [Peribacillus glennii]|nr:hypothetical protein [Peribacillus glennii]